MQLQNILDISVPHKYVDVNLAWMFLILFNLM